MSGPAARQNRASIRADRVRAAVSDDGAAWLGTAVLVRAQDPDTARAVLTPDRYAGVEVHDWQFGGRPL